MPPAPDRRVIQRPQPGWWMVKLVRRGPFVPARIWLDGDALRAEVIDEPVDPLEIWHRRGVAITESEFRFRVEEILWFREHRPNHPACHPRQAVDLLNLEWKP